MASIRKRGDLQWEVRIRRKGHRTQCKTFTRPTDARAWARKIESEMERDQWHDTAPLERVTLGEILQRYKSEVLPGKKSESQSGYAIDLICRDHVAKINLAELAGKHLADYRDRRLAAGIAPSTVNRALNIISAAINTARKEWGLQIDNPVAAIRRPAQGQGRNRRLTDEEKTKLLEALEDSKNQWLKPAISLSLETAMRQSELTGLRWENVDLECHTAHLPETKNGTARTVPLSPAAVKILRQLAKKIQGSDTKAKLTGCVLPCTSEAVKRGFIRACRRAEITDLHFHDLRHEATSRLSEKFNVLELSAVTGHKDLRMLKRYYHPRAEDLAKKMRQKPTV